MKSKLSKNFLRICKILFFKVKKIIIELITSLLKNIISYIILILILIWYLNLQWIYSWDIKSQQLFSSIRNNIIKRDTNFQIENIDFKGFWDNSIVILAYENLSNDLWKKYSKEAQKTYPGIYIFSKSNTIFNPINKFIFWDYYYKKEFELEFLPTEFANDWTKKYTYDRLIFEDIKTIFYWSQQYLIFSLHQDGFIWYKYYWILNYSFDKWKFIVKPLIEWDIDLNINQEENFYIFNECKKIYKDIEINGIHESSNECTNLNFLKGIIKPKNLKVKLNWNITEIPLAFTERNYDIPSFSNLFFSQDNKRLRYFIKLNLISGSEYDITCYNDYIISELEFIKWEYIVNNNTLLKKNIKDCNKYKNELNNFYIKKL